MSQHEYLHRLPRDVVGSPLLEILKSCLDMLLGGAARAGGLKQMGSRGPSQPQPCRDSAKYGCV